MATIDRTNPEAIRRARAEEVIAWWTTCDKCASTMRLATDVVTSRTLVGGGEFIYSETQGCPRHAAAAHRRYNGIDRRPVEIPAYESPEGEVRRTRLRSPEPTMAEALAAVDAVQAKLERMAPRDRTLYAGRDKRLALAVHAVMEARG